MNQPTQLPLKTWACVKVELCLQSQDSTASLLLDRDFQRSHSSSVLFWQVLKAKVDLPSWKVIAQHSPCTPAMQRQLRAAGGHSRALLRELHWELSTPCIGSCSVTGQSHCPMTGVPSPVSSPKHPQLGLSWWGSSCQHQGCFVTVPCPVTHLIHSILSCASIYSQYSRRLYV